MPLLHGLAWLLALSLIATALGHRLCAWMALIAPTPFARLVIAAGLGVGALQVVPMVLFATGLGTSPVFLTVIVLLVLLLLRDIFAVAALVRDVTTRLRSLPRWDKAQLVVLGLLLAAIFLRTVCPPTDGDALSYHLTSAKRFLQAGRFVFLPTVTHSNWPSAIESLFATLLAIDKAAPVAVVQFFLGLITLGATRLLACRLSGRFAAAVAVVILMLDNGLWQEMGQAYIDLGTTAFATLAVCALVLSSQNDGGSKRWFFASAIFAGLAATTKLTGVWVIAALTLVVLTTVQEQARMRFRNGLVFAAVSGLIAAPWFIRTWVLTGNPFYPALYGIFGGREWTPTGFARLHEFYLRLNVPPGFPPTPQVLQWTHVVIASLGIGASITVCLLTRKSNLSIPARFAATFMALICIFSILNLRFMLAALPSLAVCLAATFRRIQATGIPVVLLASALLALRLASKKIDPPFATAFSVATGSTGSWEYQSANVLDYEVARYVNANTPPNARVAVSTQASDTALYDRTTYWTEFWTQDSIHYDSEARLIGDLRRLGVTHIVIQTYYPDWCSKSYVCERRQNIEMPMLLNVARQHGKLIHQSEQVALFEIAP